METLQAVTLILQSVVTAAANRRGKKHSRSASASSKATVVAEKNVEKALETDKSNGPPLQTQPPSQPNSSVGAYERERQSSSSQPPTVSSHAPQHRSRASADAAIISAFLDHNQKKQSPSPGSPVSNLSPGASTATSAGSSTAFPLAADGRRPMYPPGTSHLSAPLAPKRRSTMNSRDSAAFDESIMLANVNAFKESRMMALAQHGGEKGKKRKKPDGEREDSEKMLAREGREAIEAVKEEQEDEDEDDRDIEDGDDSTQTTPNVKRRTSEDILKRRMHTLLPDLEMSAAMQLDNIGEDKAMAVPDLEHPVELTEGIVAEEDSVDDQQHVEDPQQEIVRKRRRRRGAAGFGAPTSRGRRLMPAKGRNLPLNKADDEDVTADVDNGPELTREDGSGNAQGVRAPPASMTATGLKRKRKAGEADNE